MYSQLDRSIVPESGPSPEIFFGKPQTFKLENGLTVLVVENNKLPRASASLSFDNPLIYEGEVAGVSSILDIKGVFDQVTGKENATGEMFRLYNAAFGRFPDSSGLAYWINKFSSGVDDARAVASSFLVSDEFAERYGSNVTNEKYVETLYINALGRDYDQDGYNYWLGNLNAGIETRHELLLGFAESAENKTLFTEMTGFG